MIIKEIYLYAATNIFALIGEVRILQSFSLFVHKHIVYAECHSLKLLMPNELGGEVSINLIVSVLDSAGGQCCFV